MQKVKIEGKLPSCNDYINACRQGFYLGNKMKQDVEKLLMWQMGRLRKIRTPCFISFEWHEKTKRRDKDNVAFAKKFILDAMQKAEKLDNDNNTCIQGFSDRFVYDRWAGVIITVLEVDDIEKIGH